MRRRQINNCLAGTISNKLAHKFWYNRFSFKGSEQLSKIHGNSALYQLKAVYYAEAEEM